MRVADVTASRVVLIGTAACGRSDLVDLPAVAHNLAGLTETFADRRYGAVPRENIRVLLDPSQPHTTGVEVMAGADEARDMLVVYLAGHVLVSPVDEPQFALARGGERSRSAMLDLAWVARSIAGSAASTKVLIVDALVTVREKNIDDEEPLRHLSGTIDGASSWLFSMSDPALYNQPGGAGTIFTSALLDAVHRPSGQPVGLSVDYLHEATCRSLMRESLPLPRLRTWPTAVCSGGQAATLFRQLAVPPGTHHLDQLRTLLARAGHAERNYHRPDLAAEAFRAVVMWARCVLGPDHEQTLRARQRLAHWIGRTGDVTTAVYLFQRLYADQHRVLGPWHRDTVGTENDLAYRSHNGKR